MPDTNHNYRLLALAMVLAAIEDGCKGDQAAREWLEVEGVSLLALAGLQVEPYTLRRITAAPWRVVKRAASARMKAERSPAQDRINGKETGARVSR